MAWPTCNSTLENEALDETPIWHDWTFHHIGLWISAITGLIAIALSFFLIMMHATHYRKPWEQKHIIRILLMVPIYAAVSFLSYYFYLHTVYYETIRDCYEAFAIASFFALLCHYLAPALHEQKMFFRGVIPRNWVWPLPYVQKCTGGTAKGVLRVPRSGLTWFNVIWAGVFQYCFIRVFMTIVAVVTQVFNRYCLESLSPAFSHVWVEVIEAIAVSIAMYCLIQFYVQIKGDIQEHKPLLKLAAIKLVIFLSFWQSLLISFLTSAGAIKATKKIQTPDIKVGIPAMLLCIEMSLFSVFHFWAFSWKPYTIGSKESERESVPGEGNLAYVGGHLGLKALMDAFNFWDLIKAVGRGARWVFKGRKSRHLDESYQSHSGSEIGLDQNGQKLSNISTGYPGPRPVAGKGPSYHGPVDPAEGQGLLGSAQPMPISRPGTMEGPDPSPYARRPDASPYREPNAADIGVASSSYDEMEEHERMQEEASRPPAYQPQYQAYVSDDKAAESPNNRGGPGASFAQRDDHRRGRARPEEVGQGSEPPPRTDSMNRRSAKNGDFF